MKQDRAIIMVPIKNSYSVNTLSFSSRRKRKVLIDKIKPTSQGPKQLLEFIAIPGMTLTELLELESISKSIQLPYVYKRKQ